MSLLPPLTTNKHHRAIGLVIFRLAALILGLMVIVQLQELGDSDVVFPLAGDKPKFPPGFAWALLVLLPVNVLCLLALKRFYAEERLTLLQALGIRRDTFVRDLGLGLLWLIVLGLPLCVETALITHSLHSTGPDTDISDAEASYVIIEPSLYTELAPKTLIILGIIGAIPFLLLNAATEELLYRGYCQQYLKIPGAILILAVAFGTQYGLFEQAPSGMLFIFYRLVYWGLVAALIVRIHKRLLPGMIALSILNLVMVLVGIVWPIVCPVTLVPLGCSTPCSEVV